MSDVQSWISSTAFPALGSCWDFFKKCIIDLISYVTSSRLVFIFALFLIGTIISVIVFIVTSTPDVSDLDSSYPKFNSIKQRDLYYSGFNKPVTMFAKFHFKRKSDYIFKKSNLPYVTVGGYKFYNPNYKKHIDRDYSRSQETASNERSSNTASNERSSNTSSNERSSNTASNERSSNTASNERSSNNVKKFKAMERDYFRSQKPAPVKRSKANIDIEVD